MYKLRGCGTALITPFSTLQQVDLERFQMLLRWQVSSGIDFLVPSGTTGESVTLTINEYRSLLASCVRTVDGKVPVVAGAGSNDTHHTIELARAAAAEGVDAILSVTPYYNRPTQAGLLAHYRELASAIDLPIVLYNVPGRTGTNLEAETVLELAEVPHIVGVKEASGNLNQIMQILRHRPDGFLILSGDDGLTLAILALGGDGLISVASNVIPAEMSRLVRLALDGNLAEARNLHYHYWELLKVLFIEPNPIPVKFALAEMGLIEPVYRLPLCPPSETHQSKIRSEIERLHLHKKND